MNLNYTRLSIIYTNYYNLDLKKNNTFYFKIFDFSAAKNTPLGSAGYAGTKRILKFVL